MSSNKHLIVFKSYEGKEKFPRAALSFDEYQIIKKFMFDDSQKRLEFKGNIINKTDIDYVKEVEVDNAPKSMKWICDCGRSNLMHVWPPEKCACRGNKTAWLQEMHQKNIARSEKKD